MFSFIGPIPEDKKIEQENVVYFGEIRNRDQLLAQFKQHDVLVCPSWAEGMPNVILEAMAAGMTVIATDVGASNLLVNNTTGWLISSSSAQAIADAIQAACTLSNEELQMKKETALKHITSNFTWQHLSGRLLKIISERARS